MPVAGHECAGADVSYLIIRFALCYRRHVRLRPGVQVMSLPSAYRVGLVEP